MQIMEIRITVFTLVIAVAGITACSDNSTGPSETELGQATMTTSGDVEGQKEGMADFNSLDLGALYSWEISIHDFGPQTFSLSFRLLSSDPIERPGPGTYEIGSGPTDPAVFTANYSDVEDGISNATDYSTLFGDYGGSLTITESNDNQVKGTFEFNAADFDLENDQVLGEITVSGEFIANQRISN